MTTGQEAGTSLQLRAPVPEGTFGAGLLPADLGEQVEATIVCLGAAYAAIADSKKENFRLWSRVRSFVTGTLQRRYTEAGWTAAPFDFDSFWARVDLPVPSPDPMGHVNLVRALQTDYQARFCQHIQYRLANEGNVHFSFSGPTGMGKSSCAIALADWIKAIAPHDLVRHLSFDLSELPVKLANKQPGDTVIQDEYTQGAGEGATTIRSLFQNLEDTLRASQVNLFRLSPREQDSGTMQAQLELIFWNPDRKASLFLVWLDGTPMGVIALPWCPAPLYAAYKPWKQGNVERSKAGHFKDSTYLAKTTIRVFADARFTAFLLEAANKPREKDFRIALELFHGQMLATAQVDKLVGFMFNICYNLDRIGHRFQEWFGAIPNQGLEEVARKCYQE